RPLNPQRASQPPLSDALSAILRRVNAHGCDDVASLTVGEAVMRLDLCDRPLLMFRNNLSGGINVVYRREDGLVGWLDPDCGELD
ncbi:MAG: sigma 54 modulation/S30EA ribosomal C-terminal domain-containing protein, partial [Gluconacetobacter diazotrophicus]|nr:sigma 54 modulation/S30EA ribosomal C-terminal domain-containing protein [Gluconacetobacter diazotrophicus]